MSAAVLALWAVLAGLAALWQLGALWATVQGVMGW